MTYDPPIDDPIQATGQYLEDKERELRDLLRRNKCVSCGKPWTEHDGVQLLCRQVQELTEPAAFGWQCYQDRCENAYVEASVVKRLEQQLATLRESLRAIAEGAVDPVFCAKSALERLEDGNAAN